MGELLGLSFEIHSPSELMTAVDGTLATRCGRALLTPNIQHIAALQKDATLRALYSRSLLIPDGWPVALALTFLSGQRYARVTGSDSLPKLVEHARRGGMSVAFVGGPPGVAEKCISASNLNDLATAEAAPREELADNERRSQLLRRLINGRHDFVFVGISFPKQETFIKELLDEGFSGLVVGCGAAMVFYAGERKRAPLLMQMAGLEWAHRLLLEPKRLTPRYLGALPPFVRVLILEAKRKYAGE